MTGRKEGTLLNWVEFLKWAFAHSLSLSLSLSPSLSLFLSFNLHSIYHWLIHCISLSLSFSVSLGPWSFQSLNRLLIPSLSTYPVNYFYSFLSISLFFLLYLHLSVSFCLSLCPVLSLSLFPSVLFVSHHSVHFCLRPISQSLLSLKIFFLYNSFGSAVEGSFIKCPWLF